MSGRGRIILEDPDVALQSPNVAAPPQERRRYQRVTLVRAVSGRIGTSRVYIVDASLNGLRIAHQGTLPPIGQECVLTFEWEGHPLELQCRVTRSTLHKLAKDKNDKSIYHAGLTTRHIGRGTDSPLSLVSTGGPRPASEIAASLGARRSARACASQLDSGAGG